MRRRTLLALLAICGCSDDGSHSPDAGTVDVSDDVGADAVADITDTEPDALPDLVPTESTVTAAFDAPRYTFVGHTVDLDASASENAATYEWRLGDGRTFGPDTNPTLSVSWDTVGRQRASLTVTSPTGDTDRASVVVSVVEPARWTPARSGNIAVRGGGSELVAVLAADAGELSVFDASTGTLELAERLAVCNGARTVVAFGAGWAVSCPSHDRVELLGQAGERREVALPHGSRPFALVALDDTLFVSLQARGALVRLDPASQGSEVIDRWDGLADARDLALVPNGETAAVLVSRWRSDDDAGELSLVDIVSGTVTSIELPYDDTPPSDTETGGVPTYLGAAAISPTGLAGAVPGLQANIDGGVTRSGAPLTHETTVRAVLAYLDIDDGVAESTVGRKRFDDRGLASAATYSPFGDFLYVTMRGARTVERIDVLSDAQSGAELNVGFAPSDVALSPDGSRVYVHAELSRELVVFDTAAFGQPGSELQRLSTVSSEPWPAEILRGALLFNDSFDIRIARDSYIACAHCHLDGESDRRTWDFTARGEGVRNTTSLLGRAGTAHGPIHWSANFDEIHDFEHDMRGPFQGLGFMSDTDFQSDGRDHPMGTPKAGLSEDLDALAAFVATLDRFPRSPHRLSDGTLTEAAERGRAIFEDPARECVDCHAGERMTDSELLADGPRLHDVGTLGPLSGTRLGEPLDGIDTPTLRGLWNDAPYLHDGSAATVRDVLERNVGDRHGVTSDLADGDLDDLADYLLSLE